MDISKIQSIKKYIPYNSKIRFEHDPVIILDNDDNELFTDRTQPNQTYFVIYLTQADENKEKKWIPEILTRMKLSWERNSYMIFLNIHTAREFVGRLHIPSDKNSKDFDSFHKLYHYLLGSYSIFNEPYVPQTTIFVQNPGCVPYKKRVSDVGYDIFITGPAQRLTQKTTLFHTGVRVTSPQNYYFRVVPRSSISKLGYMLANSEGTIDQTYDGEIMLALTRIDTKDPDGNPLPTLEERIQESGPIRIAQLIMAPAVHFDINVLMWDSNEMQQFFSANTTSSTASSATSSTTTSTSTGTGNHRGEAGFGSSGFH